MIDTLAIIHRYYPEGSDIERVLRQHAEDVTGLALELVDAHPEMGLDREFVAEAAMLHDIGIYQTSAPEIFCTGKAPYILHGYLGAELLRSLGLPRHAWVAERHTGSGLTPEEIAADAIAAARAGSVLIRRLARSRLPIPPRPWPASPPSPITRPWPAPT